MINHKSTLIYSTNLNILMIFTALFVLVSQSMADDLQEQNLLKFPKRINYPDQVTLYHEVEIRKEKGGELQRMVFCPIASYSKGFIYGWERCSQSVIDQGYQVLKEDRDAIISKMMIQTLDGDYAQGLTRGYLDCHKRLKFLFEKGVPEELVMKYAKMNILPQDKITSP
ncbi:hypothetical protein [Rubinisphaera italica]|uniref:Uncharacterized protein n=1 Tax=Rubinisphaera italica TaxID=2527969 RepID=A0A5C5XK75_9PLAN|nr:hypothetical protein [Rubinisphaera italica]TWT63617.1 hypothetical protein Pan54_43710 [Rubinisphaera italica]